MADTARHIRGTDCFEVDCVERGGGDTRFGDEARNPTPPGWGFAIGCRHEPRSMGCRPLPQTRSQRSIKGRLQPNGANWLRVPPHGILLQNTTSIETQPRQCTGLYVTPAEPFNPCRHCRGQLLLNGSTIRVAGAVYPAPQRWSAPLSETSVSGCNHPPGATTIGRERRGDRTTAARPGE